MVRYVFTYALFLELIYFVAPKALISKNANWFSDDEVGGLFELNDFSSL